MPCASKPELLLPVGNIESLFAALEGGADAIYLGLKAFNARGRAANFTNSQFAAICKLATQKRVKVYVTLVECRLETGRTHQIRIHMKFIGHPLFNDPEYGGREIRCGTTFAKYSQFVENCFTLLPGQALHAKELGFDHPVTGKRMMFDSELPDNFKALIDRWRTYTNSKD